VQLHRVPQERISEVGDAHDHVIVRTSWTSLTDAKEAVDDNRVIRVHKLLRRDTWIHETHLGEASAVMDGRK